MRFLMKQKLLSFGDDFVILNEQGDQVFYFDGKVGSIGKKIVIKDHAGQEIAVLRQRFATFRPTFTLKIDGEEKARIFQQLFSFRKTYGMTIPGGESIKAVGRILEREYQFFRGGQEIASASKKWVKASDTYGVEITHEKDILPVLACAAVIDLQNYKKRDSTF